MTDEKSVYKGQAEATRRLVYGYILPDSWRQLFMAAEDILKAQDAPPIWRIHATFEFYTEEGVRALDLTTLARGDKSV